jgi:hypothetical protein
MMDHPVFNFLIPASRASQVERLRDLDVDAHPEQLVDGLHAWSLQTFLILKKCGAAVALSDGVVPGAVNLGHAAQLSALKPRADAFLVSLQVDYPKCYWADLHVVQNQAQVRGGRTFWLPHWPQAGLIERDPARNDVQRVGFAGQPYYLAGGPEAWTRELKRSGLAFTLLAQHEWHDFSSIDVLVAIRSFDRQPYNNKSPIKLINAWLAGVPLIAGHDSAFKQIGTPGEDYILVENFRQALDAIQRLREDREYYRRMVANGKAKAAAYTRDRTNGRWMEFLHNVALPRYFAWTKRGPAQRVRWHACAALGHLVRRCRRLGKRLVGYKPAFARQQGLRGISS